MKSVVLPIIAGITLAEWLAVALPLWIYFLLLPLLLATAFTLYRLQQRHSWPFQVALIMLFALCGMAMHQASQPHSVLSEGVYTMRLHLYDNPQPTAHSLRTAVVVKEVKTDTVWQPVGERVMAYLAPDSTNQRLRSGDIIEVTTRLRCPADTNFSSTFNYRTYLRRKGVIHTCFIASNRYQLLCHHPTTLHHLSQNLQQRAVSYLANNHLSPKHQITAAALLFGQRDNRLSATRSQFICYAFPDCT